MIHQILLPLLNIDTKTLISVLFWGSLISGSLLYSFRVSNPFSRDKGLSSYSIFAKAFQTAAYFSLFFRGEIPDLLSVNGGNSLLLTGFYWEAMAMLAIIHEKPGKLGKMVLAITVFSIVLFNTSEYLVPKNPSLRVGVASVCVFLTLFLPACSLLFHRKLSNFKRVVGLFYVGFLAMLIPRAYVAFTSPITLLSNTFIQTLTFLSLVLLMIFSLSAYLLLMKESTDAVLHQMATTDALTGLSNRQSFLFASRMVFQRHAQGKSPLSVLFFDLDNFKRVNDNFGHTVGDQVISDFAKVLCENLRPGDFACRYGGEEFVVVLSRAEERTALGVGERILRRARLITVAEVPNLRITTSAGLVSAIPEEGDTLETYIQKADSALYAAKSAGKDRIVLYCQ